MVTDGVKVSSDLRVALVHDELVRRGGAEGVFEELIGLWPQADVFALYAGRPQVRVGGRVYSVQTSFLQRLPRWFRQHPARVLPLLPQAAEAFDLSAYDLVISSASGFAKGVVTRVGVPHLCYCHTPTRYLWDATHDVVARIPRWQQWPGRLLLHYLRLADVAASGRPDIMVANSRYTEQRITRYYRRDSQVVYPPIDTSFYTPASGGGSGDYFLVVGRLTPAKRFDQAVRVCAKLELPLVVIGKGSELGRLKRMAGPQTRFLTSVGQEELRGWYRGARALLMPGEEDFGMAMAEMLSCGRPVVALGRGGAQEIVEDGVTGVLYAEPREEALAEALRLFLGREKPWHRSVLQQSVLRFGRHHFEQGIRAVAEDALAQVAASR